MPSDDPQFVFLVPMHRVFVAQPAIISIGIGKNVRSKHVILERAAHDRSSAGFASNAPRAIGQKTVLVFSFTNLRCSYAAMPPLLSSKSAASRLPLVSGPTTNARMNTTSAPNASRVQPSDAATKAYPWSLVGSFHRGPAVGAAVGDIDRFSLSV